MRLLTVYQVCDIQQVDKPSRNMLTHKPSCNMLTTELHYSWNRNTALLLHNQFMENENCLPTWSILIVSLCDAIFSKNWCSVTFVLSFQHNTYGHYSQETTTFCIYLSILVQTETNIVLNKWKSASCQRVPWFGAVWYNISIPWMVEFSDADPQTL